MNKVLIAILITKRRLKTIKNILSKEILVTDQEWEILISHKTVEAKLIREKFPGIGKRVNRLLVHYKKHASSEDPILKKVKQILSKLKKVNPQISINGSRGLWIVKPAGLSRGRGITILSDLKRILEFPKEKHYLVQKYIENPMIILNRKFDIRQWVLITSWNPLIVWMYDEMYIRFGAEDYSMDSISSKFMHLTNNSVTKHYNGIQTDIEGNMWSNSQFVNHLKSVHGKDEWNERIKPKIKQIIIISLKSAQGKVVQREGTFEILGYDFMIDEELHPWLIEVNASPAVDYSTVTQ